MGKTIAAVIIATALAVSGWTYAIARPATVHNVSHTATRIVREPSAVRTVIKWKTRTVTVAGTANGNTAPCVWNPDSGTLVPQSAEGAGPSDAVNETCSMSVVPDTPYASGVITITLTDAAGHTESTTYYPRLRTRSPRFPLAPSAGPGVASYYMPCTNQAQTIPQPGN